ncbi:MAG: ATP synthase F1 subunit epsilon [Myxococcota bacterium]
MALQLKVDIVTPERAAFRGPAAQVVVPAWNGELGILPEHDAVLCLLRAGTCQVFTESDVVRYVIGPGFAEIGQDHVTILTNACEEVSKIDKASAARELQAAESEMTVHDTFSEKYRQAQLAAEHARARLDA